MKTYELKLTRAMGIGGVLYRAGAVVKLDEALAKNFLRRGAAELVASIDDVVVEQQQEPDQEPQEQVNLQKLTKQQLLEVAAGLGIEVSEDQTKADIIAAIEGAQPQ